MAGSYPDAPSRRMAYDADGTVFWRADGEGPNDPDWGVVDTTTIYEYNQTEKANRNSEHDWGRETVGWRTDPDHFYAFIFPEKRDLYGVAFWVYNTDASTHRWDHQVLNIQWSPDTTNGVSGTWYQEWASITAPASTYAWANYFRVGILTFSATNPVGVRGFRWVVPIEWGLTGNSHYTHTHIYGTISPGQTPDRLLFIDEDTGLEFDSVLDWGDVPRGSTWTHNIRIRNNSTSLTAVDNLLDFEALTGTSDTWYTIKETGGAYAGTLTIASIAPSTTYPSGSNVITIRLQVPDTALSLEAARLRLSTGSWT